MTRPGILFNCEADPLNTKNMSYLILTFSYITYKKYVENEIFSGSKRPREITLSFSSVRPSLSWPHILPEVGLEAEEDTAVAGREDTGEVGAETSSGTIGHSSSGTPSSAALLGA